MKRKTFLLICAVLIAALLVCVLVACDPSSNNQNGGLNDGNDGGPDDGGEIYYTVTFDSQGGSMVQSVRVKSGDKLTAPANPTRTSYNFGGWYKDSAYTKIWDFSVEQVTQDITLYARWIAEDGKIIAVENAKIDGLDIFMAVRNEVTDVRLANAVTIGGNAVWKLYLDKLGTQEIPTKIAASTNGILREGDNVFYIVSTSSDGQQVRTYTLTIHRSYYATVSVYDPYDKLYNTYIRETYFESFTPPAAFTGYTITSWNVSDDRWQNDGLIRQNTQFKPICQANKYTVNLNAQGGQCSSTSATLTYDSSYKLPVPTKTGYVFMGWSAYTSGGSFVTDDCGYSKANWKNAQSGGTLYAIWALGSYEVTARANDETAGVVVGGGTYKYGSSVTLSATTNAGYTFVGWYEGEEKLSDDLTYSFTMPAANVTYTAKWIKVDILSENTAKGTVTGLTGAYKPGDEVTVTAKTNAGYTFVGWYEGEEKLSDDLTYSFTMPAANVTYTAKWIKVDILSENTAKGTVTGLTGAYKPGDEVTVTAKTNAGYTFVGWYENDEKLSGDLTYTFTMPAVNVTYTAVWQTLAEMEVFMFSSTPTVITIFGVKDGDISAVEIPSYSGVSVQIAQDAFTKCKNLNSVTIGSGVTSIGDDAFSDCSGLTSVTIPDSVTSIGSSAFYNCSGLTSVTIGNGVTSIGERTFYGCSSLTSITIPDSVMSIGSDAFSGCMAEIVWGGTPTITEIGDYAFANYAGTSITIPDSVTSIGSYAFSGCAAETIWGGTPTITEIGDYAFANYAGTSITIPDSVTSIGGSAFEDCDSLESITLPFVGATKDGTSYTHFGHIFGASNLGNNDDYVPASLKEVIITGGASIGEDAFWECTSLTSVTIGDGVTSIGGSAFRGCASLSTVVIGNGVTSIGSYAFEWCTNIVSATMPAHAINDIPQVSLETVVITSGDSIGDYAFRYCDSLTSITIPDSVTSIGSSAFYSCDSLTSITIPDSVTSIGESAFSGCDNLQYNEYGNALYLGNDENPYVVLIKAKDKSITSVDINASTKVIYGYAFSDCTSLTSVTIPDGVTSIGSYAFYNCTSLATVAIPDSVTSIRNQAFQGCSSLTSVTIPDSVTSIGSSAFSGCSSLESITLPFVGATKDGTSNTHFGYIFGASDYRGNGTYLPTSLKEVIITGGTSIGSYAFYCTPLTSVTIPDSVTSIGAWLFEDCTSLTSIHYAGDMASWLEKNWHSYVMSSGRMLYIGGNKVEGELVIPNGIASIPSYAFAYQAGITSVTIPDSVTSIGSYAFRNCDSLTSVHITDIGKWVAIEFDDSYANPLSYAGNLYLNGELVTDLVIPTEGSVKSIGNYAFSDCTSLTSVTIPDSVTSIGNYAFAYCTSLTSVTIPDSVTSIGYRAFYSCDSLTSVIIPDSVTGIGRDAFSGCDNLQYNEYGNALYLGNDENPYLVLIKAKNRSMTSVNINASTKLVHGEAFQNCDSLTSITIPDSVTSIGDAAFYSCDSLTSITIPDSVTSIGSSAFYSCALTSVTIPASVTSIGSWAFEDCDSLTSVTFEGTMAEWNAVSKGYRWNYYCQFDNVECSDGEVAV